MINNGITINNKHSYNDFDLYVNEKNIGIPEKKSIISTVPFMNGFYDFSNLLGSICFDERIITYTFDLISSDTQSLEEIKTDVLMWLMLVHDTEIYDDDITGYHFKGSYDSYSWSEDLDSGTLEVTFKCYPFKIANEETTITLVNGDNTINYNGCKVVLYAQSDTSTSITINSTSYSISTTKTAIIYIDSDITVNYTDSANVTLSYRKEVI